MLALERGPKAGLGAGLGIASALLLIMAERDIYFTVSVFKTGRLRMIPVTLKR